MKDTYRTIAKASHKSIFKDRGSKFYAYAFPIKNETDVADRLKEMKSLHHKARHWCYAWQIGTEKMRYRVNDDGEPSNSAGQPIYGQILSKDLTNVLIVVVRYFGGVKLGVGGLITAYKTAALLTLDTANIITKTIDEKFLLVFEYQDMNKVQRIIKECNVPIENQKLEYNCEYQISIRKGEVPRIIKSFEKLRCIKIKKLD